MKRHFSAALSLRTCLKFYLKRLHTPLYICQRELFKRALVVLFFLYAVGLAFSCHLVVF